MLGRYMVEMWRVSRTVEVLRSARSIRGNLEYIKFQFNIVTYGAICYISFWCLFFYLLQYCDGLVNRDTFYEIQKNQNSILEVQDNQYNLIELSNKPAQLKIYALTLAFTFSSRFLLESHIFVAQNFFYCLMFT